jgi:hypothetical protein
MTVGAFLKKGLRDWLLHDIRYGRVGVRPAPKANTVQRGTSTGSRVQRAAKRTANR